MTRARLGATRKTGAARALLSVSPLAMAPAAAQPPGGAALQPSAIYDFSMPGTLQGALVADALGASDGAGGVMLRLDAKTGRARPRGSATVQGGAARGCVGVLCGGC